MLDYLSLMPVTGKIANSRCLIKRETLPPDKSIKESDTILLIGIGGGSVRTLGTVIKNFFGIPPLVHVGENEIPIPCMGIIRVDYLSKDRVIIDFGKNNM